MPQTHCNAAYLAVLPPHGQKMLVHAHGHPSAPKQNIQVRHAAMRLFSTAAIVSRFKSPFQIVEQDSVTRGGKLASVYG